MRSTLVLVQSQWLLCVFVGVCVPSVVVIHSLPWHVSCPAQCVCQIKPWFSSESVYHEAPTVDCNDLLLTELPLPLPQNTHTLRLQSNLLSELESAVLCSLPNLTELDLSQNHFSSIRTITQSSSLPSLLSLHLEENRLNHLPEASFSSLPALQELFLSHNSLYSLAPGAFTGLDSLLRLHINNNRLTTIDPRWFRALPRLEVLMLGGNPVEVLPERGFQALGSLRSLVLSGMGLRSLAEKALEGLDGLESLSFYDNLLTKVPTQALKRVPGLKFLDLNKNRIKLVETGDFRDMVHLKELGLNNMEDLVSIERAALENLPELTKLEITNNPRLSYIHPQAFLQLSRLESLMLNSNSLSALHRHTLLSLPSLQEVSLHSNPLRCDCLFHWAAEPQATLCSEPPELRARRVKEVSTREMAASCLPMIPHAPLPSYVGVREGGSLTLHCRALAEPQPKLYWVTPSGLRLGPAPSHVSNHTPDLAPYLSRTASEGSNHTSSQPSLDVREVGEHYAVLSWQSGHNLPSTQLSWQAIYPNAHTPTYTTRILAGTQSFNLTHLHAETFYSVCLHLGSSEGVAHTSRRTRESTKPQCVSFRTKEAPEPKPSLQLSPELTSTALTLLFVAVILLLLAGQGWDTVPGEEAGKHHSALLQWIKSHKSQIINQKTEGSSEHQPKQSVKLSLHLDC
uniref:Leucine rich repeat neuronal 2 n=1 Tax=Myripristis murdjan TaxID=586833 RepID=A0A668ADH0_9TELE